MCGICGYVNTKEKVNKNAIEKLIKKLRKRGPNEEGKYITSNTVLGQTRLSIIDIATGKQPMEYIKDNIKYVIIYNGEIYNTNEIKKELIKKGHTFKGTSDTEAIIHLYAEYKEKCLDMLNGIFAFSILNTKTNELFLARDRLGIKPLYYTQTENMDIVFASEIKAILSYKGVYPIIDNNSVLELLGMGPGHSIGKTYYKNIYEIKPGHYAIIKNNKLHQEKYWKLEKKECKDSLEIATKKVKNLVTDSIKRQLISDVGICSMLSGGLDSSIISKVAKDNIEDLETYSLEFKDNSKNFQKNSYQISQDPEYVEKMIKYIKTKHIKVEIDYMELYNTLAESLIARDAPGMADIDSSMFLFCKTIRENNNKVALSGECSDEIFCGYPWMYKEKLLDAKTFPWALSIETREKMINKNIKGLKEYIENTYKNSIKNISNKYEIANKLTIEYFMQTLLERTDRMSMSNSLEVRVPFADHRIFEYVYSLPIEYKLGKNLNEEKYILRRAFEAKIPNEIINRKKNPFPKTYNPKYLEMLEKNIKTILKDKRNKIFKILDYDYIYSIVKNNGKEITENFYGQLMTYPQILAYIVQIDMWLEIYDIIIEID